MMGSMTWGHLITGRTGVKGAFHAGVTKIRANVAVGGGSGWHGVMYQDSGGGEGDPLSFCDLDSNDNVLSYCRGCRGSRM